MGGGNTGSRKAYNWSSKELNFGDDSQNKSIHNVKLIGTNSDLSSSATFKIDGSAVTESFKAEGNNGKYTVPFGSRSGRNLKIELTGISGSEVIDAIGITFRRKVST